MSSIWTSFSSANSYLLFKTKLTCHLPFRRLSSSSLSDFFMCTHKLLHIFVREFSIFNYNHLIISTAHEDFKSPCKQNPCTTSLFTWNELGLASVKHLSNISGIKSAQVFVFLFVFNFYNWNCVLKLCWFLPYSTNRFISSSHHICSMEQLEALLHALLTNKAALMSRITSCLGRGKEKAWWSIYAPKNISLKMTCYVCSPFVAKEHMTIPIIERKKLTLVNARNRERIFGE